MPEAVTLAPDDSYAHTGAIGTVSLGEGCYSFYDTWNLAIPSSKVRVRHHDAPDPPAAEEGHAKPSKGVLTQRMREDRLADRSSVLRVQFVEVFELVQGSIGSEALDQ